MHYLGNAVDGRSPFRFPVVTCLISRQMFFSTFWWLARQGFFPDCGVVAVIVVRLAPELNRWMDLGV